MLKQHFSKISKTVSFLILFSFVLTNTFVAQSYSDRNANLTQKSSNQYPTLTKYTTDLTALARDGKLSANTNFAREVDLLIKSLSNGGLRQSVILDTTGDNQELDVGRQFD